MKTIAIIGTSTGQKGLMLTARKMGLRSISFSIPGQTDYSFLSDKHYRISITDIDKIVQICREENVSGVVSCGSDFTAPYANEIAYRLGLPCNDPDDFNKARNKSYVRKASENIALLSSIKHLLYTQVEKESLKTLLNHPVIVKPAIGAGKTGLSFVSDYESLKPAIEYAKKNGRGDMMLEEYVEGLKLSVECLSYNGQHYIIQTTEAETSGFPHFVEIAHHLPANISKKAEKKIRDAAPLILDAIKFKNGACNLDMIVDRNDNVYLIEVNLRGAGGNRCNNLIELSTGYDYLQGLIEIALGEFKKPFITRSSYAGDFYLCAQTKHLIPFFKQCHDKEWLVESTIVPSDYENLIEVRTNADRKGYIIYNSNLSIREYVCKEY